MKKKVLSGLFALALLATAGFGVNKSMKSDAGLSDLALMNVEALAQTETGQGFDCLKPYDAICYTDWDHAIRYLGHRSTIGI
jgi:hypothetical protein